MDNTVLLRDVLIIFLPIILYFNVFTFNCDIEIGIHLKVPNCAAKNKESHGLLRIKGSAKSSFEECFA